MSIMNDVAREIPPEEPTVSRAVVGNVWLDRVGRFVTYSILTVMAIAALMPLYWMFTTSLKAQASYLKQPPELIPVNPTLENFQQMFANPNMANWIFNSFFISISVTLLNIFLLVWPAMCLPNLIFPDGVGCSGPISPR